MVRQISYNSDLSLEEIEEIYREVEEGFETIRSNYSGLLKKLKRRMNKEDIKQLWDYCIKTLLPLSTGESLQCGTGLNYHRQPIYHGIIETKITQLYSQIIDYLASFKNSGITLLNERLG